MKSLTLTELAKKLVEFPTVSQDNSTVEIAAFVAEYLEGCGFEIKTQEYIDSSNSKEGEEELRKVNVVAYYNRIAEKEPELVFSGHMDTVKPGQNLHDPWDLFLDNDKEAGKVYRGLGIADMKFFLAIMLKAGEIISKEKLSHPFALCFTSDEEIGCGGIKELIMKSNIFPERVGKYVVIGEPTCGIPVNAHKGYIHLKISVRAEKKKSGKKDDGDNPAHSSNPMTTTNVVEKALPVVLDELRKFRIHLEEARDNRFDPPFATTNVGGDIKIGRVKLGERNNKPDKVGKSIIPRGFVIDCDIRPIPGQDPEVLVGIVRSNIEKSIGAIHPTVSSEKLIADVKYLTAYSLPMETSKSSPIVKALEELSGKEAVAVPFNTEGGRFNRSGSESVIFGPADIKQAHKDNEYVSADLFNDKTVELYLQLIRKICGRG